MKLQISSYAKQIPNLYLMKIQISFYTKKKIPDLVFNESTDQVVHRKNFISVFNENTNKFLLLFFLFSFFFFLF